MYRLYRRNLVGAILSVILLVGCGHAQRIQPSGGSTDTQSTIFSLSFQDIQGNSVSLASLKGRPLVVNLWASWCTFCKKELIDFSIVQGEVGDDVSIVAINRAESPDQVRAFIQALDFEHELVLWLDSNDNLYKRIGGFAMPETLFVDANGTIVFHKRGVMDKDEIRHRVLQLIENTLE